MAPASTPRHRLSLWSRPLDLLWTVWFLIHIVVMLFVDLNPLWPLAIKPQFMTDLRQWYIVTYRDRFFVSPPPWFTFFMWMEALYHMPLSIWAVGALVKDDPLVPVHLLVWAVQTAVTTGTCVVEYMAWEGLEDGVVGGLHGLYGPYLGVAIMIGLDMLLRLNKTLVEQRKTKMS